jgi:hypothetical protein
LICYLPDLKFDIFFFIKIGKKMLKIAFLLVTTDICGLGGKQQIIGDQYFMDGPTSENLFHLGNYQRCHQYMLRY